MSVVRRIMSNRQCEVYFSLMYEALNRWKGTPEFEKHLDSLFGCPEWRDEEHREGLYNLYERQLRTAGAKHVVHFDIYSVKRLIYSIFFATQHELGCDRMKAAIWKIAPEGGYEFRGTHVDQLALNLNPNFEPLRQLLLDRFGDGQWHSIEAIQKFMRSDQTDYHCGHLKMKTLRPMEEDGLLEVDPSTRKRPLTFPDRCVVRFVN